MSLKQKMYAHRISAEACGELKEKTVSIKRVAKVVKGGRRFGFSCLVVSGDGRGHVGYGLGKAAEVPDSIRKGGEGARKNLIRVPMKGATIPHEVIGKSGATEVILRPGSPGTGVIAGSAVRAVVETAGIHDIRTKVVGSSNPYNVLRAVFDGLLRLRDPEAVASMRSTSVEELGYTPHS